VIVSDRAGLAETIVRAEQAGKRHVVPVLRAAAAGMINAGFVMRGHPFAMRPMKRGRRPVLIILGDDDHQATGPAGWPQAERLLRWARLVVLHGAGGEPQHYAAAVLAAQEHRRVLMIETSSGQIEAWRRLIGRVQPRVRGITIAIPAAAPPHPMERAPAGTVLQ
jgi:pimeloyl-ACP methyl ester carboxylesterase